MSDRWSPVPPSLSAHERAVKRDLELLALPAKPWLKPKSGPDGRPALDVLVLGAGMCGIGAAALLGFRGIDALRIVDRAPAGFEGPWKTYARMDTLRSPKELPGPTLGIPGLSFRAWYEAANGSAAWEALYKIPNAVWQDYLTWLAKVTGVGIENGIEATAVVPAGDLVRVELKSAAGTEAVYARRVVVATGRGGAGGQQVPDFVDPALWPDLAAHTNEAIDFDRLKGKRIAVIGGGSSGFDNAATALEQGAARVDMFVRRQHLPQINKGRGSSHPGYHHGWPTLSDAEVWSLISYLDDFQAPPPHETVHRTLRQPGFHIHLGTATARVRRDGDTPAGAVIVETADGRSERFDFAIVATGFQVDLANEPALAALAPHIETWGDRPVARGAAGEATRADLARHPYVGPDFALTPKGPDAPAGLDRIHLFNFGARANLKGLSDDIPGVDVGIRRLADAVTAGLFRDDLAAVRADLEAFAEPELISTPFYAL